MTLYRSDNDAETWTPLVNIYGGGAAYSSAALLGGEADEQVGGQRVGVLFEKDNMKSLALAIVDQ